jgi:hypothetical protein
MLMGGMAQFFVAVNLVVVLPADLLPHDVSALLQLLDDSLNRSFGDADSRRDLA